jgi:arylsulfatase A-like enzyme
MFGAQGRRAKNTFYDEAVRVPFLMRWPGHISAGSVSDACLNTPDIMPTLLSLLGLPVPEGVEGMDLAHCALGRPGPEPEAAWMQCTGATAIFEDGHEWRALRQALHLCRLSFGPQRAPVRTPVRSLPDAQSGERSRAWGGPGAVSGDVPGADGLSERYL